MSSTAFSHVLADVRILYDAETGEVLHTHETVLEVEDGRMPDYVPPGEVFETIRRDLARAVPGRRIEMAEVPAELRGSDPDVPQWYRVDPKARRVERAERPDQMSWGQLPRYVE